MTEGLLSQKFKLSKKSNALCKNSAKKKVHGFEETKTTAKRSIGLSKRNFYESSITKPNENFP